MPDTLNTSIADVLNSAPWQPLELHLNKLKERIDASLNASHALRVKYRKELLADNPDLVNKISRPSESSLQLAQNAFKSGIIAASDGTVSPVPLLAGSKIQVGVVIVSSRGDVVDLVTRVFETELISNAKTAREYFSNLRNARSISNLLSRAIMLFGERKLLFDHYADWRFIHGELIPHELRTGAGKPAKNLPLTFELMYKYIESKNFIAVSEASDDIDILNAAILLQPGEYIVIRSLQDSLNTFLYGDSDTGQAAANFIDSDKKRFREFIASAGPKVAVVLVKAGIKPFLIECHVDKIEEAVSMFLIDALWVRGLAVDGSDFSIRGFPFHIDLADQVARTLFKGSDFRNLVETCLYECGIEAGLFDIDPRRLRG
ncbi:hypothetical protein [Anaerobranca gottschalkii]|uniref:NurA domain-containing protein n=1 Tax=Anaerobranca gottschalkii DSM 13577 TaxID=1120990 RepID=A0A1I0C8A6_9FIRM|nr:hypothetical protein [Anaerobranca gottschalkii]SET15756.1 hypothetical protein SAMN03080614_10637 [Anaerobranca gottschalkii DSM 13577]